MKKMRKMKRFNTGGPADEYKGTDEIVQYRMGQIKDPGVDLFKLARGEEQEAKPVPLDKKPEVVEKNKYVPNSDSAMDNRDVGETAKNTYIPNKDVTKDNRDVGETAKKQSFGEAFKSARAGGDKTFTYNGKSYTTELAKPSSSSSSSSTSNAKPAAKADTKADTKNPYDSDAANAAIKAQANLDSAYTPSRAKPKTLQEKRDTREARRKAIDAKTSGMASKDRDAMRKGGSVKKMAGGGKVKSASARADGCAIRGKTRA